MAYDYKEQEFTRAKATISYPSDYSICYKKESRSGLQIVVRKENLDSLSVLEQQDINNTQEYYISVINTLRLARYLSHDYLIPISRVYQRHNKLYTIYENFYSVSLGQVLRFAKDHLTFNHWKFLLYQLVDLASYLNSAGLICLYQHLEDHYIDSDTCLHLSCYNMIFKLESFGPQLISHSTDNNQFLKTETIFAPLETRFHLAVDEKTAVWQLGIIFANMLGINQLALDQDSGVFRSGVDQIRMLFELLGRQSEDDILALCKNDATSIYYKWLSHLNLNVQSGNLEQMVSKEFQEGLPLLRKMLALNPDKRISLNELVGDQLFAIFIEEGILADSKYEDAQLNNKLIDQKSDMDLGHLKTLLRHEEWLCRVMAGK